MVNRELSNSWILTCIFGCVIGSGAAMAAGFVAPSSGTLYMKCIGGNGAATSIFGTGTSQANFVPYLTGVPQSCPSTEVSIGSINAGQTVQFGMSTVWGGQTYWAFSNSTDQASTVAFNNLGGSILQQTSSSTWVMHLDDAASYTVDDDNDDILIQLRLAPPPVALSALTYATTAKPSE